VTFAKMAEPTDLSFGLWTQMNHKFNPIRQGECAVVGCRGNPTGIATHLVTV